MKFWKTKIISKITKFHNRSIIFTFKSTRKRHDVYGYSQSSRPEFQHDQTAQSVEILLEEEFFFLGLYAQITFFEIGLFW